MTKFEDGLIQQIFFSFSSAVHQTTLSVTKFPDQERQMGKIIVSEESVQELPLNANKSFFKTKRKLSF